MRKTILVYLLIEAAFFLGCDFGKEDCGLLSDGSPKVGVMSARMVKYKSYNEVDLVSASDSIALVDLAVWVDADPYYESFSRGGGGGRLLACSPNNPQLENEILNIKVVNSISINDTIPPGADLSEMFAFKTLESEELISNLPLLNDYFRSDYYLFLVPEFEIAAGQYIQFDVRILLEDQQYFDLSSNKVFVR